ncbi:MAG: hypothetical protein N7Q72_06175, partial [Spiroplasma sp. Tabriz.8]|nr:hypothetical protein [Spiroplasma sp. Tabriz.8]
WWLVEVGLWDFFDLYRDRQRLGKMENDLKASLSLSLSLSYVIPTLRALDVNCSGSKFENVGLVLCGFG